LTVVDVIHAAVPLLLLVALLVCAYWYVYVRSINTAQFLAAVICCAVTALGILFFTNGVADLVGVR
jgi:hypothetical protein